MTASPQGVEERVDGEFIFGFTTGVDAGELGTQLEPDMLLGGEASYLCNMRVSISTARRVRPSLSDETSFCGCRSHWQFPGGMERAGGRHAIEAPGALDLTKFTRQQAPLGVEYDF